MSLTRKTIVAASAALAIAAVSAQAATTTTTTNNDGFYASILAGISKTPSIDGLKFKTPSYQAGASVGYNSGPLSYEVEGLFINSSLKPITYTDELNTASINYNVKTRVYAGMVNAFYHFDNMGGDSMSIAPYVGVGAGIAHVKTSLHTSFTGFAPILPAGTVLNAHSSNNAAAVQAIVGAKMNVADSTAVTIDYRYLTTVKKVNTLGNNRYQNHSLNLGLVYQFDKPQAA